jgi:integrase
MVGLHASILEVATIDYELLSANPLRGILSRRRRFFPSEALRPRQKRPRIVEPEEFKHAVSHLPSKVAHMVLTAALAGLRWGELVALRIEDDIDFRRNKIHVTRQLYKRIPQTPKTERSERDVDMSPIVRQIMKSVPWSEGFVFSPDGRQAIGEGSWIKRQWRKAQVTANIRHPVRWYDLRHQYVSLLIAAGKSTKYIAEQAGHSSAGFTLDTYGHLFETIKLMPAEWPEDLLWPAGLEGDLATVVQRPAAPPIADRTH